LPSFLRSSVVPSAQGPLTPQRKCPLQDENSPTGIPLIMTSSHRAVTPDKDSSMPGQKHTKYTSHHTPKAKLATIFQAIQDVNWSFDNFLFHAFSGSSAQAQNDGSRSHTTYVNKFLKGGNTHGVGAILRLWLESPMGSVSTGSELVSQMYNLKIPYNEIKAVR
ncbi:hypothetical protein F5I97DRAFT_1797114, partial [Phlebopus sp. FC_14]